MPPRRRRAVPATDPALVQRVRKSFGTAEIAAEATALIEEAEKAVATAGDTLSASGKLNPSQGEVASAIHGNNVPPKPKKTGPAKLEDENGEAVKPTAHVSPATAPVSFSETPVETSSVARAVARKKVDPDSLEGKALELYVAQVVEKASQPVLAAVPSIEDVFKLFVRKYDDSQPRGPDGKWVGEGGGGGMEGSISQHKPSPSVAGGPKYAMDLGTANALGTALAAFGYNKEQVLSHLAQEGYHANGRTAQRVLASHAKQLEYNEGPTAPVTTGIPTQWVGHKQLELDVDPPQPEAVDDDVSKHIVRKALYCEFVRVEKADKEEQQIVSGIVLAPEVVDAQGDIYDEAVIEEAAHKFLAKYNAGSKMGHLHKEFNRPLDLVESYIAPIDMKIGKREITKGTWMMAVKIKDPTLWEKVKNGELTGFSIGGVAKVQKLGN